MKTFRLAAYDKNGDARAFGDTYSSLRECVSAAQVANWKRRRHDQSEAVLVQEYQNGAVVASIPL